MASGDIRAAIPGVSDVMLTRRLRELEAAELVERRVIAAWPVHVEYPLTKMGREAGPVLEAVIAWSHAWIPLPADATDDAASHPPTREPAVPAHGTGRYPTSPTRNANSSVRWPGMASTRDSYDRR